MIKLSCCYAKGYASICIIKDRACVLRDVRKSVSNGDRFDDSLDLFERAFYILRTYIESNSNETSVVIESNNKTFIKWLERGYSTDKYNDKFYNVIKRLNQIPIEYTIIYEPKLVAIKFANKVYVNSLEVSKDLEVDTVEENNNDSDNEIYYKPVDTTKKLSGIDDIM